MGRTFHGTTGPFYVNKLIKIFNDNSASMWDPKKPSIIESYDRVSPPSEWIESGYEEISPNDGGCVEEKGGLK
jgi:hypothetical protein